MQLSVEHRTFPMVTPLVTAHGTIDRRRIIEVEIRDGEHHGRGEVAPLPGFGLESLDDAERELQGWAEGGPLPRTPGAAAAVADALSSLAAAQQDCPLDSYLSGQPPVDTPLAVQALIGAADPEEVARAAAAAIADGYRGVKLKVAVLSPSTDVARIRAARDAMGDRSLLRLDANQGWSPQQAHEVLTAVRDVGIDLVEEPTAASDHPTDLGRELGIDIAADEQLSDAVAAAHIIEGRQVDAVVLKPAVVGGLQATYTLAERAMDAGLRVVVSSFIDGEVGLRGARDLALALAPHEVHGIGTAPLFVDQLAHDVTPHRGHLVRDGSNIELPSGLEPARSTPAFDLDTVPAGLLRAHAVAAGVWGVAEVLDGSIGFVFEDNPALRRNLTPGQTQVIPPQRLHHVELGDRGRFRVTFYTSASSSTSRT